MNDYSTLTTKLTKYFKSGKNILLEGKHGTGKTSLITEIFNANCKKWLYFSGATLDPWVDFVGIPKEIKKGDNYVLSFVLPESMSDENVEAIFIDEYNRSHKKVKNGTMELIQFKSINGRKFPNLKVVWAAINPSDDEEEYAVEDLDPAQEDRFQIYIKMPNHPDYDYFTSKYGKAQADAAIEWWNGLPEKIKNKVSPRRLDYAMEVYNEDGDIFDVLKLETNPSKLLATLKCGSLEVKIKNLFKKQKSSDVNSFFANENQYQGSLPIIRKNAEYMKFFLPILDNERISSLYFTDEEFKNFILQHAVYFKKPLEEIQRLNKLPTVEIQVINRALKQIGEITVF
jgi:hypothetical protein